MKTALDLGFIVLLTTGFRSRAIFVIVAAFAAGLPASSQTLGPSARDAVVDLLLFGAKPTIDPKAYSPDIRTELGAFLHRYTEYQSGRSRPEKLGSEQGMIYTAWVGYERRLAAISPDRKASALAAEYVDRLKPCYEWEGLHDCPEREARFAADYYKANPGGPFGDYLLLLAGHRWLCAAEAYEYEKQPRGAERNRREYNEAISAAKRSNSALIRLAAERIAERHTCFAHP